MQIAMVGLGKMGLNMARRLGRGGHQVVGFDPAESPRAALAEAGGKPAASLAELVSMLAAPRAIWIMVPAGEPVDRVIAELRPGLAPGDVLIDGGNSNYKDSQRRARELSIAGFEFVDAGTSGGIWGLENGYCLMLGGTTTAIAHLKPALDTLAPPEGWLHVGAAGAGHYTKMIHNGIEYGMMQAYAEGFEILKASDFAIDLRAVAALWNRGSVVRSWLLELTERAFAANGNDLAGIRGFVPDSGEGRWTVDEAVARAVPAPVLAASLFARFASRQDEGFANQLLSALRGQFGGHEVKTKEPAR